MFLLFLMAAMDLRAEEPGFRIAVEKEPGAFALFMDLEDGATFAAGDTAVLDSRVPAASWSKLFTAYALQVSGRASRETRYPCHGWAPGTQRCWYSPGHGSPDLVRALATSCNSWFAQAIEGLPSDDYRHAVSPFWRGGLPPRPGRAGASAEWRRAHLAGDWNSFSPRLRNLAEAVISLVLGRQAELAGPSATPALHLGRLLPMNGSAWETVREGMSLCAREGTARGLSVEAGTEDLLAKTASARERARGGGHGTTSMAFAFWPAHQPRVAAFVFVPRGIAATRAAPLLGTALKDFLARRGPALTGSGKRPPARLRGGAGLDYNGGSTRPDPGRTGRQHGEHR